MLQFAHMKSGIPVCAGRGDRAQRRIAGALVVVMCAQMALSGPMDRFVYESLVRAVGDMPPVIRTTGLENYSSNRLDYVLMNGLAMTRGGRIYLNWISGEDGTGSFTAGNWSDDGGQTWTDVNLVIDGHDGTYTDRNNIIGTYWLDPDGRLRLYTDQSLFHYDRRAGVWESVCANPDDAVPVWSKPRRLCDGHVMNKPIVLRNGDWAFSAYLNDCGIFGRGAPSVGGAFADLDALRGASCYVSSDRGKTWKRRGTVKFPGSDWQESQLLERKDGTLRVFSRVCVTDAKSGKKIGGMMASDSHDGGWTWSRPHALPSMDNVNARFQVMRLASGRLLFVCHGLPQEGGKDGVGRVRLSAYLSDDDGASWQGGLVLDPTFGSYPDAFQSPDGTICVAHDHGRGSEAEIWFHRFTEEDVLAGKIVSRNGRLRILAFRGMASERNKRRFGRSK